MGRAGREDERPCAFAVVALAAPAGVATQSARAAASAIVSRVENKASVSDCSELRLWWKIAKH